jgi:hypothetical protein
MKTSQKYARSCDFIISLPRTGVVVAYSDAVIAVHKAEVNTIPGDEEPPYDVVAAGVCL